MSSLEVIDLYTSCKSCLNKITLGNTFVEMTQYFLIFLKHFYDDIEEVGWGRRREMQILEM